MLLAMPPSPDVIGAIGQLLQPLLETLERVLWAQRNLYPPLAPRLAEPLAPGGAASPSTCPSTGTARRRCRSSSRSTGEAGTAATFSGAGSPTRARAVYC